MGVGDWVALPEVENRGHCGKREQLWKDAEASIESQRGELGSHVPKDSDLTPGTWEPQQTAEPSLGQVPPCMGRLVVLSGRQQDMFKPHSLLPPTFEWGQSVAGR
jgi:hypothetical protein